MEVHGREGRALIPRRPGAALRLLKQGKIGARAVFVL
jgi:hypothetical protein